MGGLGGALVAGGYDSSASASILALVLSVMALASGLSNHLMLVHHHLPMLSNPAKCKGGHLSRCGWGQHLGLVANLFWIVRQDQLPIVHYGGD